MHIQELRRNAQQHIGEVTAGNPSPDWPPGLLPEDDQSQSLESLIDHLDMFRPERNSLESFENVVILGAFLSQKKNQEQDAVRQEAAIRVREWVSITILPTAAFAERSLYSEEQTPMHNPDGIAKAQFKHSTGLSILSHLQQFQPLSPEEPIVDILTCLTAFTDKDDSWSCLRAQHQASNLLQDCIDTKSLPAILSLLLQERVKPAFAKSKNPAITFQARKAITPLPVEGSAHSDLDMEIKPWKFREVYIATVFQWVLKHLDAALIETNWHLIIPPLLTLIDDTSPTYKAKGCNLLTTFLHLTPSPLLERTGLGEVFESTLMPCLLYLPTLTEEAKSLQILHAAYKTLIALARVRFPEDNGQQSLLRMKALDRILKVGIFKGYAHAGEHVRIAEVLVDQITNLVNEMGIESVRYLKNLLPLLSANLAAPFATAYPPLILASIRAIESIMINDWPRVTAHRGEILKGLTICWCRIIDYESLSKELDEVRRSIKGAVRLLTELIKSDVNIDLAKEYDKLIESDSRLHELLLI